MGKLARLQTLPLSALDERIYAPQSELAAHLRESDRLVRQLPGVPKDAHH